MKKCAQLKWRCRRGLQELDILLTRYLEQQYPYVPTAEQQCFETLLEQPDVELYTYFIGQDKPANEEMQKLIAKIRGEI